MVSLRFIVRSIAASLAQPADLERGDWASEAFELEVACGRGLHGLLHSCEKALADQDLPRRRPSAEPHVLGDNATELVHQGQAVLHFGETIDSSSRAPSACLPKARLTSTQVRRASAPARGLTIDDARSITGQNI